MSVPNVIDYLEHWVRVRPDRCLFSFLDGTGREKESYTYRSFDQRTRVVAQHLTSVVGLRRGDRVLLAYPPGLELIVAFFGCARVGVIPVPIAAPAFLGSESNAARLSLVTNDCQPRVVLTTAALQKRLAPVMTELRGLGWIATEEWHGESSDATRDDPDPILFLQYTSGSTSEPKGVVVLHENVIENALSTVQDSCIGVSWLPQYHDMGLIGYYLFQVISGGTTYGFSPFDFLKRPLLWLKTVSRFAATHISSPNFGFEYCLREDKIPSAALSNLDLSSLRVVMNASEPVRAETQRRFFERFRPCGLRPEAQVAAYGLAENTLAVTRDGRRVTTVDGRLIASCGVPLDGVHVKIVDPATLAVVPEREIGEIWVAGKSACAGYWNQPALTAETFNNFVEGSESTNYLRTGDLGFMHDDELFVCGRIKDVIIVRGANFYAQDIESAIEACSRDIRTGGVVAFQSEEPAEALVIMAEVVSARALPDPVTLLRAIRVQFAIDPRTIVFVAPGTILRTTSGKVRRSATRRKWLDDELPVLATHDMALPEVTSRNPSGPGPRLRAILARYGATGREEISLTAVGIDSLDLVTITLEIEAALKEHQADDLISDVDNRYLQRVTVAELTSWFELLDGTPEEAVAALRSAVQEAKDDGDGADARRMRSDARLEPMIVGPASREPLARVLLTGPTGFLGPFLLRSLLQETPFDYEVLIRATDAAHGLHRIRRSLCDAGIWTPALDAELEQRAHIVCGDIARPNLGLDENQWNSLATRVQAVMHNAAVVNYVMSYDALRSANVEGVRELLRLCFTGTRKEFHFVSSTIIFGWTAKDTLLETDDNADMEALDFGYAQSKWVAEQLVIGAEAQGLSVKVYRPSFITASTAGVGSRNDIVVRLLTFMINRGLAVRSSNQISFLPVDMAADNLATIFGQRPSGGRTLHVTVDRYYSLMDVTRLLTDEHGYSFVYHDIPHFVTEMKRRATRDDPVYPLVGFFSRSQEKIGAMQHKRYNNDGYRRARELAGGITDPALAKTVSYLVDYMRREGLIEQGSKQPADADRSRSVSEAVRGVHSKRARRSGNAQA